MRLMVLVTCVIFLASSALSDSVTKQYEKKIGSAGELLSEDHKPNSFGDPYLEMLSIGENEVAISFHPQNNASTILVINVGGLAPENAWIKKFQIPNRRIINLHFIPRFKRLVIIYVDSELTRGWVKFIDLDGDYPSKEIPLPYAPLQSALFPQNQSIRVLTKSINDTNQFLIINATRMLIGPSNILNIGIENGLFTDDGKYFHGTGFNSKNKDVFHFIYEISTNILRKLHFPCMRNDCGSYLAFCGKNFLYGYETCGVSGDLLKISPFSLVKPTLHDPIYVGTDLSGIGCSSNGDKTAIVIIPLGGKIPILSLRETEGWTEEKKAFLSSEELLTGDLKNPVFSPNNEMLAVVDATSTILYFINVSSGMVVERLQLEQNLLELKFSPNWETLFVVNRDGDDIQLTTYDTSKYYTKLDFVELEHDEMAERFEFFDDWIRDLMS